MDNRRIFMAIALMMVIAVVPSLLLKRPNRAVAPALRDSVAAAPAPAAPPVVAPPAPTLNDSQSVAEDTVTVTTPLARYFVSTRGGRLVGIELGNYRVVQKSGTTERPVNLVRPSSALLGLTLIRGRDTLPLSECSLTPSASALQVSSGPTPLTLRGECRGTGLELTYTFLPDDYQVGVRGRITGYMEIGRASCRERV